jgi:hypothetical protein
MPDTDQDDGSLLDGALNVAAALGEMFGDAPAEQPQGARAKAKPAPEVIEVEATVITDEPAKSPTATTAPPSAGTPPTAPPVEARQTNGRAFLPSTLAAPLYRLAAAVELLNQDFTAARAAGTVGDHLASNWTGWRGDLLAWAGELAGGAWPREDEGGVRAGIQRRHDKLPRWRELLERESGRRAAHSRGRGEVAGVRTSGRTTAEAKAPGIWEGLPTLVKGALVLGIGWGAVQVVPAIIDAISDPLGRTAKSVKSVVEEG